MVSAPTAVGLRLSADVHRRPNGGRLGARGIEAMRQNTASQEMHVAGYQSLVCAMVTRTQSVKSIALAVSGFRFVERKEVEEA